MLKNLFFLLAFNCCALNAAEYQSSKDFLREAFSGQIPKPRLLWLNKEQKQTSAKILQHKLGFLRTRYWLQGSRSVWILEELGKTKPITVGVVIENDKIISLRVLTFRESRGWEVKHDFFTNQFKQIELDQNLNLSQPIDGISGATLSVRALTKIAKLALYFNRQIANDQ